MPERRETAGSATRAGLPTTFVLSACLIAGFFLLVLPAAYLLIPAIPLEDPFPDQHQDAESFLYVLFFFLSLPAGILAGPRLADRFASAHSPAGAALLAALLAGTLAGAVVMVRVSDVAGVDRSLLATGAVMLVWWILAALMAGPLAGQLEKRAGGNLSRAARVAAALLAGAAVMSAVTLHGVDKTVLVICLAVSGASVWAWGRASIPALSGWKGRVADLAVVLLFMAAIPDIPIYRIGEFAEGPLDPFLADVQQFHAALWLAPVNAIDHGRYLLVDIASQYGVGSIYFIAGVFTVVPMDYGTLNLLDAVLAAAVFGMGWAIIRMAGVTRVLALATVLVILPVLVWGTTYPVGAILQNGAIRFGLLPFAFMFFRLLSIRRPGWARPAGFIAWVVVGVSAIWALEGMLYTSAAVLGIVLVEAMSMEPGDRRSWLAGQAARFVAAWAVAHVAFALFTLALSGSLPDWGLYITYLREFLTGRIGDLTYDYEAFSPALPVATAYMASALLLVLVILRKRDWFLANRLAMIAVGGLTLYGIMQYSYFDNRSMAGILPYVCLPMVLVWVIWLDRLLHASSVSDLAKRSAIAATLGIASISVAMAWPVAHQRVGDTALVWALPGGKSLGDGLHRLGHMPPLKEGADEGQRLLDRYMPGEDSSAVATAFDLDTNILIRSGRDNRLGITDAKEGSWVPGPHRPVVTEAVDELEPGTRMLVDENAKEAFRQLRRNPAMKDTDFLGVLPITSIQALALREIGLRFNLKTVARGTDGLSVVELVPRVSE